MLEKKCDLSVVLKVEADWENLIFFVSVFQRVGAKKEKERSPYDLVFDRWNAQYTVV